MARLPWSPAATATRRPRTLIAASVLDATGPVTATCAGCGADGAPRRVRVQPVMPPWLPVAAVLVLPYLLDRAVGAGWAGYDLYSIMAGEYALPGPTKTVLLALPVALPALWAALVLAVHALGHRGRFTVSACPGCARRHAWWRVARAVSLPLVAGGVGAWLYLARALPMDERRWGILFAPWVAWVVLAENARAFGGARFARVSAEALAVRGLPALGTVLAAEKPERLAAGTEPRLAPPLRLLVGWAVPVLLALVLHRVAPLEARAVMPCGWGTWPLSYRSGVARMVGCHAADGSRHGPFTGGPGGWNTSSTLAFEGPWWFGASDGAFRFTDAKGVLRVAGAFSRQHAHGTWRLFDETGTLLEEVDGGTRTLRRAHPHLVCPEGAVPVLSGDVLYGERRCEKGGVPTGPFVWVRDGVVAETGAH